MKVLAIDDMRTLRDLLAGCLRGAGYEVVEAENGQQGLERLAETRPDLVITDLNMPIMDGIEFTRQARATPPGAAIPVLILTTETSDALRAEGRRAGATGWMVKPFVPDQLLGTLKRLGC